MSEQLQARSTTGWRRRLVGATVAAVAVLAVQAATVAPDLAAAPLKQPSYTIGVVEQQLTNPFFGAIETAAKAEAGKYGVKTITAEAKSAGDAASQVTALEDMINRGVKGIVVDPANATALVGVLTKARSKGILVLTVNTGTSPRSAANAAYETDNLQAGKLIGRWAKAQLKGAPARVALLDYDLSDRTAKARHDGFLAGFGITATSPEVAGSALTQGSVDTGQTAMENLLSAHNDINVVYTINEPVAQGAYTAVKAKGLDGKALIASIDGSCSGVRSVQSGAIGATVMQFPKRMGKLAVDAIVKFVKTRAKPAGIINPGTVLITDQPAAGVPSQTSAWGLKNCWGS
jgi:fructose transport system substrate-binding protein